MVCARIQRAHSAQQHGPSARIEKQVEHRLEPSATPAVRMKKKARGFSRDFWKRAKGDSEAALAWGLEQLKEMPKDSHWEVLPSFTLAPTLSLALQLCMSV